MDGHHTVLTCLQKIELQVQVQSYRQFKNMHPEWEMTIKGGGPENQNRRRHLVKNLALFSLSL
jgi:hypothetical protein